MKKRTTFIGAILSLISLGQPLIFKNFVVLSSSALITSLPVNVNAETAQFYIRRADEKFIKKDYYAAISDYNRAIEIDPSDPYSYIFSGYAKLNLDDINGACFDWKIAQRKDAENIFNVDSLLSSYCYN